MHKNHLRCQGEEQLFLVHPSPAESESGGCGGGQQAAALCAFLPGLSMCSQARNLCQRPEPDFSLSAPTLLPHLKLSIPGTQAARTEDLHPPSPLLQSATWCLRDSRGKTKMLQPSLRQTLEQCKTICRTLRPSDENVF